MALPDQFQIFAAGNIAKNSPFVRVPYSLVADDNGEGLIGAKRQDFPVIVVMQKQVND